jgi:hypothetical protein
MNIKWVVDAVRINLCWCWLLLSHLVMAGVVGTTRLFLFRSRCNSLTHSPRMTLTLRLGAIKQLSDAGSALS